MNEKRKNVVAEKRGTIQKEEGGNMGEQGRNSWNRRKERGFGGTGLIRSGRKTGNAEKWRLRVRGKKLQKKRVDNKTCKKVIYSRR